LPSRPKEFHPKSLTDPASMMIAPTLSEKPNLEHDIRAELGKFGFKMLIGNGREDPCLFARGAPLWLADRPFNTMNLRVRLTNAFAHLGIEKVANLADYTHGQLLQTPKFGRKSVSYLLSSREEALREGPYGRLHRDGDHARQGKVSAVAPELGAAFGRQSCSLK